MMHNDVYRGFEIEAVVRPRPTQGAGPEKADVGFAAELAPGALPESQAKEFLRRYPTGRFAMSFGTLEAPLGAKIEAWAPVHMIETGKTIVDALLRTLIG